MSDQAPGRNGTAGLWTSLERRSAAAFLVGGVLLFVFTASNGIEAFTNTTPPAWVNTLFVVPGIVAGHLGLLGLYPRLADRTPRLAPVGAVVVAAAGVAALGLFTVELSDSLLGADGLPPGGLFYMSMVALTILGFVLFGVAALRSGATSRTVALLLLVPPTEYVVMIVTGAMAGGDPPAWSTFLLSGIQAGAHLAIGAALAAAVTPTDRPDPSAGAADD